MFLNKVVVITGGAGGIGKCIAEEFRKNGATVCIIDCAAGDHYVGDIGSKEILEDFARGGVGVSSGVLADSLTFGSESGDGALLNRLAELKMSEDYADSVRGLEKESRGRGSAVLFDAILRQYGITQSVGANDKLGGEYIRFGRELGMTDFRPVKRMTDAPSATKVREILGREGLAGSVGWIESQIIWIGICQNTE